jgi:hypothetical protein
MKSSNLPGNVANIVMVMSTLLYLLTAITPLSSQIFKDRNYLREGFCVYDDPALWFLNSHLLCVFVDTLGALLLYFLAVRWEAFDKGAMGKVKENTIGTRWLGPKQTFSSSWLGRHVVCDLEKCACFVELFTSPALH